jgi:hypothetical protein
MSWFLKLGLFFAVTPMVYSQGQAESMASVGKKMLPPHKLDDAASPTLKITMWVYNLAQVPASILNRAEKEARRIFYEIGIQTEWRECPVSSVENFSDCQPNLGPAYLNLRIVPQFDSTGTPFRNTDLGFALPTEEGGIHASVFYHRVQKIAEAGLVSQPQILGHALAHEIGHLLLGSNSHSPTGLMRADWGEGDLKKASLELLRFSRDEAGRLRAAVSARMRDQENFPATISE